MTARIDAHPTWCDRVNCDLDDTYDGECQIHAFAVSLPTGVIDRGCAAHQRPHDGAVWIMGHVDNGRHLEPYINVYGTDIEATAITARQLAAAFMDAADKLDEITDAQR